MIIIIIIIIIVYLYSTDFITMSKSTSMLIFRRSVLMVLVFYLKGMLGKVSMQRTQQFSDFSF